MIGSIGRTKTHVKNNKAANIIAFMMASIMGTFEKKNNENNTNIIPATIGII
tara:strand:- start:365 stop:520 length:156 start_codon:yes stop_codon:yes gene_type:complete